MLWKKVMRHEIQNEKVQHTFNRDSKRESRDNLEMEIFKGILALKFGKKINENNYTCRHISIMKLQK